MEKLYNELTQDLIDELLPVLYDKRIEILVDLIKTEEIDYVESEKLYITEEIILRMSNIGSALVNAINERLKTRPLTKEEIESNLLNTCDTHYFTDDVEEDLSINIRSKVLNYFDYY